MVGWWSAEGILGEGPGEGSPDGGAAEGVGMPWQEAPPQRERNGSLVYHPKLAGIREEDK